MHIESLSISNFLGVSEVEIQPTKPVVLVAAQNGAGKSSIREAIIQAVIGDVARVKLKKDFGDLIHGDAKRGQALIAFDSGITANLHLPSGERSGEGKIPDAAAICLMPERFAAMDEKELRRSLFSLMGVRASAKEVAAKLKERGVDPAKADEVIPLMAAGFDHAAKEAKAKVSECRGAWKAATGEQYGSEKAEGWKAEKPKLPEKPDDEENRALQIQLNELQTKLGALQERQRQAVAAEAKIASAKEKAGRIKRIEDKLKVDRDALAEWQATVDATRAKAAGKPAAHLLTCPECTAVVELRSGMLHHHDPNATLRDPEAAAALPEQEQALGLLQRAVANGERDLAEAKAAEAFIESAAIEPVDPEELRKLHVQIELARATIEARVAKSKAYEEAKRKADQADQATAKATQAHKDLQAWDAITKALEPNGIPAELLSSAVLPFNDLLREESEASGFGRVLIDSEMGINYNSRPYALCSESEKWRADAMIAVAVARKCGFFFVMLDRFDVLDAQGRSDALYWLDGLAEGKVGSLVLGTMKSAPKTGLANIESLWLEGGVLRAGQKDAVQA